MNSIFTKRLELLPLSNSQLEALVLSTQEAAPELSAAYAQMLQSCRQHPAAQPWYAPWELRLRGEPIGYVGFHGPSVNGSVEIGYGIHEGYERQGYATEGVQALCAWALAQPGVMRVEAETEPQNAASQAVLAKVGFLPTGTLGAEGPRFVRIQSV